MWTLKFLTYLETPYSRIIDSKIEGQEETVCDRNVDMFIIEFFGVCACMVSYFSHVRPVTLWTVACQAPLSMGFSRQEYWSGFPLGT